MWKNTKIVKIGVENLHIFWTIVQFQWNVEERCDL